MIMPDHKKLVYLPHIEYRLIAALYSLACDGINYCLYKEYFDSIEKEFKTNPHLYVWHRHTLNAYYDIAKLFGAYSEPTHYYHLLNTHALKTKLTEIGINPPNEEKLKSILLETVDLSVEKFDQYHQITKDYRDRNLIHREHSPSEVNDGDLYYPPLFIAKETFLSLALLLIKLSKQFPDKQDEVNFYKFIYDDFDSKNQICDLIEKSIPKFIGNSKID